MLVYEINNLRAELKRTRDKVASYETALGFNASHATEAAEMRLVSGYNLMTAKLFNLIILSHMNEYKVFVLGVRGLIR